MKQEFKLRNYRLDYPDISVFTTSPWCSPLIFIVYRCVMALYTTIWSILGVILRLNDGAKWLIFLTNWSYTFLNVHFIISFILSAYYHYVYTKRRVLACDQNANEEPDKQEMQEIEGQLQNDGNPDKPDSKLRHPRMLILTCKASWAIYNVAANIAFLVTAMYWAFDYVPGQYVDGSNANAHAVNSVLVIIDVMVCNVPFRIFHLIYPLIYGIVYTSFTVIYWAAGGTNHKGKSYIYAILDYENNAGLAFLMAAMFVFLAVPISQFLVYCLYRIRVWIVKKRQLSARNDLQKI
ncbi:protein rolling stone [Exaiptasia diaphana]|uniref:Protein rolling stone n=1 Tax=Exaiptasia diaphana TaxID=2652724 RepID=A0A913XNN1_EXADI|nr:protein rolling stone [Exaiptasia diaphana]KXJ25437.1 Protein rolling stone [Exaiptasia diaphana]